MIIAGTNWQIPIINKIHQMGFKTLTVNLYEDSPAFKYSDYNEVADILDKEKCLCIAKKYKIDAVLSEECDIAMPTVAYIADSLNLHSLGTKCAKLYTDKSMMRLFCHDHNLFPIEYKICSTLEDVVEFFEKMGEPIIMKPLDSNSSRGVFKINCKDDILYNFKNSIFYSKERKSILAEQYIDGCEFTVDGIKVKNQYYILAISEKKHYAYNTNIANELFFSHYNEKYDYELLRKTNRDFVLLSDLPDGCLTHAEYKYSNGQFFLIEIAARGGGNLISSDIVPIMSGFDNYRYLINASLGIDNGDIPFDIDSSLLNRCAVLHFFDVDGEGGVVERIDGLSFMEVSPNILTYKFNFQIGDRLSLAKNDAERIGFYIAFADTKTELLMIQEKIRTELKIIYK